MKKENACWSTRWIVLSVVLFLVFCLLVSCDSSKGTNIDEAANTDETASTDEAANTDEVASTDEVANPDVLVRADFSDITSEELGGPGQGFGDRQNSTAWSMAWWNGKLYVGTVRSWNCWGSAAIEKLLQQRFPNIHFYPPNDPFTVCEETVEALSPELRAEIWTWTPEVEENNGWERVYQAPMVDVTSTETGETISVARELGYRGMTVYTESDGTEALYVSPVNAQCVFGPDVPRPRILRIVEGDGEHGLEIGQLPLIGDAPRAGYRGMVSINGKLYVIHCNVNGEGPVYETADPLTNDSIRQITPEGMLVFEMAVFEGFLYLGTFDRRNGYSVIKTDVTTDPPQFTEVVPPGAYYSRHPAQGAVAMVVYKDSLMVGTGLPTELIRIHTDDTWDLIVGSPRKMEDGAIIEPTSGYKENFGWYGNGHIWRMCVHQNVLYVGTMDDSSASVRGIPFLFNLLKPLLGYDVYATVDGETFYPAITKNGFDNNHQSGARTMASTPYGLMIGGACNTYGLKIWQGIKTSEAH